MCWGSRLGHRAPLRTVRFATPEGLAFVVAPVASCLNGATAGEGSEAGAVQQESAVEKCTAVSLGGNGVEGLEAAAVNDVAGCTVVVDTCAEGEGIGSVACVARGSIVWQGTPLPTMGMSICQPQILTSSGAC